MPASRLVSRRVLAGTALASLGSGLLGEPSPSTGLPALPAVDRAALTAELDAYRATRGGTQGLAVRDLRNGETFEWRSFTNETLSTVKVLILISCLRKLEQTTSTFTDLQHNQARRMIQRSDNDSTDALLAWVTTAKVQEAARTLGLARTTIRGGGAAGTENWWGYSTTQPADLLTVLGSITPVPTAPAPTAPAPTAPAAAAQQAAIIHGGHRAYIRHLMAGVVTDQRWGVADAPLPRTIYTETKNGWGPMVGGYRLNSIGRVLGNGRDYQLAILTRSPRGFRHGRETINGLSTIVYQALAERL